MRKNTSCLVLLPNINDFLRRNHCYIWAVSFRCARCKHIIASSTLFIAYYMEKLYPLLNGLKCAEICVVKTWKIHKFAWRRILSAVSYDFKPAERTNSNFSTRVYTDNKVSNQKSDRLLIELSEQPRFLKYSVDHTHRIKKWLRVTRQVSVAPANWLSSVTSTDWVQSFRSGLRNLLCYRVPIGQKRRWSTNLSFRGRTALLHELYVVTTEDWTIHRLFIVQWVHLQLAYVQNVQNVRNVDSYRVRLRRFIRWKITVACSGSWKLMRVQKCCT